MVVPLMLFVDKEVGGSKRIPLKNLLAKYEGMTVWVQCCESFLRMLTVNMLINSATEQLSVVSPQPLTWV